MTRQSSAITGSATARTGGWIGRAYTKAASLLNAVRNRRNLGELLKLDDAMLRDIGLSRQDVQSALAEPLFRDASWTLSERAAETREAHRRHMREDYRWATDRESDAHEEQPRPSRMGRAA